jgi:hypothetical protein
MDYGSRRSGSRAADVTNELHPLFFLDYISIVGLPLQPITRATTQFFDNVTVTFKNWQMPYPGKHLQSQLNFGLENRTFQLASAATRETWYIVMHPIAAPVRDFSGSRQERLKKRAKSDSLSALKVHHAQVLASYIKDVFLSNNELYGGRIEPSWNLGSTESQKLTCQTWTLFQTRFMEDWPNHADRHSYDPFWVENHPAFHAHDYGANIQIEVNERLRSLEKETRLRPEESSDDDTEDDTEDNLDDDDHNSDNNPSPPLFIPIDEDDNGDTQSNDDWLFDLDNPNNLYSEGLQQLHLELDQKYYLNHISRISYALAVDLHCLEGNQSGPEQKTAVCLLADRNMVRKEYTSVHGTSGFTFYPMAFHPAYGNFTSACPPAFLKDHVLAIMQDNMSYENDGADVLSCQYFQAYSNIKRSIRYNPEDLLVTQGIATAALTLPTSDNHSSGRVRAKQQQLLDRLQGNRTPDDPEASKPFARERQRIQHALVQNEFAYRMEQVVSINVANLVPRQRKLRTILRPIFQLMRFYLQEKRNYIHILRTFQPDIFPQILGSFARVFELATNEMLYRYKAQGGIGLGLALSEGVAALDRLGHYCFTGSQQVLMGSVLKPLRTLTSLERGGWPFINPEMLDLRYGTLDIVHWPRGEDERPILMHVAALAYHYGPEVAASRLNMIWFRDLGGTLINNPVDATNFLQDVFHDLWLPEMVAFVSHQLQRRASGVVPLEPNVLQEQQLIIKKWSSTEHPFSWR